MEHGCLWFTVLASRCISFRNPDTGVPPEESELQTQIVELTATVRQFCELATADEAIDLSRQDHPEPAEIFDGVLPEAGFSVA